MGPRPRIVLAVSCFLCLSRFVRAEEPIAPPTPAQQAALERVRPLVDAIWLDVRSPSPTGEGTGRYFFSYTDRLIAVGPDAVPFLVSELELMDPNTFHLAAYVLGRFGGPDAEAALRKAVRAAESIGGNFGKACKRYALFGLALLGAPDAFELAQTGLSMHGAQVIPEIFLAGHMSLLIGPAALPILEKQLEIYRLDPSATDKLGDTILAIGRVADASFVPTLEPFLANPTPEIRAVAADAISRIGEPRVCDLVLPLLSSSVLGERRWAAHALKRSQPASCYKGILARLEVEPDMGIRAPLYSAVIAIAGEASLDAFRSYLKRADQYDKTLIIHEIGRIGSTKGLNTLRSLFTDESQSTVIVALEAIGAIGGEGAVDTLLAATSDPRRQVASAARDVLVAMGIAQVAPRVAAAMVDVVKAPVGDTSLRTPIAQWGDALVRFKYLEPIDDLKAAAAVQPDPEIKDALDSCVRRLQSLRTNGEDVALWTQAFGSAFPDVRRLAGRRLAEIGSKGAVRALKDRLSTPTLPPEERADIMTAIGESRTSRAAELVELHLSDPAYDAWELKDARAAAAWAARRLGGDRMIEALRASALRRDGRDWATLVYFAVLEKGRSVPTLRTLRGRRLRHPEPTFGHQLEDLDLIIAGLSVGHDPVFFDVPPKALLER